MVRSWKTEEPLTFCPLDVYEVSDDVTLLALPSDKNFNLALLETKSIICSDICPTDDCGMLMDVKINAANCLQKVIAVAAYENGSAATFSITGSTFEQLKFFKTIQPESIMSLSVNFAQGWALSCGADNILSKWSIYPEIKHLEQIGVEMLRPGNQRVAIFKDSRICAVGGWDGAVRVFQCNRRLRPLGYLMHHLKGVQSILCLENQMFVGSEDGTVSMWALSDLTRGPRHAGAIL